MPCSISQWAKSGWSDGPCPQIPMYLPALLQASIAIFNTFSRLGLAHQTNATRYRYHGQDQALIASNHLNRLKNHQSIPKLIGKQRIGWQFAHHDDT